MKRIAKIRNTDVFAAINSVLFMCMCVFAYSDRFIHYRGRAYLWEFFIYAVVILLVTFLAGLAARRFDVPTWALVAIQLGTIAHFTGGLAVFHESRLYDKIILGIRYDKYVHMLNACIGGILARRLPWIRDRHDLGWLNELAVVISVLGVGAVVEVVEYFVVLTVEVNGVGSYDNNMLDLSFNLLGAVLSVPIGRTLWGTRGASAKDKGTR